MTETIKCPDCQRTVKIARVCGSDELMRPPRYICMCGKVVPAK